MIRIVTDSTCDLPEEELTHYGIEFVPLNVNFGEESYLDKIEISSQEFYKKLKQAEVHPSTSQPSPDAFEKCYREISDRGDQILSIHISSKLSGTIQSANIAKEMLPDRSIHVFDSGFASLPLGFMARYAAQLAEKGAPIENIKNELKRYQEKTSIYFMVDTLEYLRKGGRIGKAQAMLGGFIGIKPVLTIRGGEVLPQTKARSKAKAVKQIYELLKEEKSSHHVTAGILYSDIEEPIEPIMENINQNFNCDKITTTMFGPVIGVHLGPGAVGVCMI